MRQGLSRINVTQRGLRGGQQKAMMEGRGDGGRGSSENRNFRALQSLNSFSNNDTFNILLDRFLF